MNWSTLTESVLPIWILFFTLTPIWVWLTILLLRQALSAVSRPWSWKRFHRCESGSSYSFSYLLIIPPYILLMFCILECTLMLVTKMGTVYAAFAGARSAIVHYGEQDADFRDRRPLTVDHVLNKARVNATQAMIPFASGKPRYQRGIFSLPFGENAYVKSYNNYYNLVKSDGSMKAAAGYLKRKYRYAMAHTRIETNFGDQRPDEWNSDVELTLTFSYPFQFSIIGRIFGEAQTNGYYARPLKTTVTLQNEAPQNRDQKLGIHYASN